MVNLEKVTELVILTISTVLILILIKIYAALRNDRSLHKYEIPGSVDLKRSHPRVKSRASTRKGRGSLCDKRVHRSRALNLLEIIVKTPVVALAHLQIFNSTGLDFKNVSSKPRREPQRP